MIELSQADVRAVMIAAQGLHQRRQRKATKADVLSSIRQMQVLQIDTIHVVARSPYLVLWSRLGDYEQHWLDDLLAKGSIFEYWAHAACFLPIEDYALFRPLMVTGWEQTRQWLKHNQGMADSILAHVRTNGGTRSADFERKDGREGGWWNWKDEKIALERLLWVGELMVAKRHNFQRIYDLRERVLPDWDDAQMPDYDELRRVQALKTVQALGVTKGAWVADYFRMKQAEANTALKKLLASGEIQQVSVEGWSVPGYVHPDHLPLLERASKLKSVTTLLSPFDPIVWDRKRATELFNFDYTIECYTPAPKRKYGYFTLPILYNNQLIGRLDPKAHRKEKLFEVKALHLEPGVRVSDKLVGEVASALRRCADWHKTPEVVVRQSDPAELAPLLNSALQS